MPNINTASKLVDGVFVTDPTRRVVNGEVIEDRDADGFAQARGNRGDVAVLTVDLDGLVTYATGGAFPPLEFAFERIEHSIADVLTLTADFYYSLFDVELVASLPLVQEFTLTPELGTRMNFFEVNPDGSKGAAKPMEIVQLEQVLLFDENGLFRSDTVAGRLAELAKTSTLRVAQDVAQFVDFDAGIPGAFTGQTASIGGRVVVREGDGEWRDLFTNAAEPIARSAPALGQDQLQPLDLSGLSFGYRIFRDDVTLGSFEIVEFDFDEAASIFRFETRETVAPLTSTPFLSAFDALNLRYDGADTFVEVEYRAQPHVHNRTGLDFDLELVLSAMEFYAGFGAYVDLGFTEIGESVHKGEAWPGEHEAIVDADTWAKVHTILQISPRQRAARTRAETPTLLKGLLFGPDGAAFSPTHTRKGDRLYRYYVSQTVLKHGAGACPVGRVPAGEIEAAVIHQLRAVFRQPEIVAGTWKAAHDHTDDISEAEARAALQLLDPLWDELFPAEQARIVALLVERADIGTNGLKVRLRIDGLSGLAREMLADGVGEAA